MTIRVLAAVLLCGLAAVPARAQPGDDGGLPARYTPRPAVNRLLPPVDLGIPNFRQRTRVWCWAAVAQQIIHKERGKSPPQCALVAMARGRYPSFCCPGYQRCAVQGTLDQIRGLIRNFGRRVTEVRPPTGPMSLYRTLRAGHPVILALRNSARTGHVVVLTGMTWARTDRGVEAILHINDPIGAFPPRIPFRVIIPRWHAAIVVY
jgi:hypothetical protein